MRNIYDIITEQKIIVDINITSYDMDYTINHLSEQCDLYCVQEGMGEGIKNVANKIIEFIKSIIRKIRELIQKVINFFTGKRDTVKRMDKQIQDANNGIKPSDQGSPEGAASVAAAKKAADEQAARTAQVKKEYEEKKAAREKAEREEKEKEAAEKRKREEEQRVKKENERNEKLKKANNIYEVLKNSKTKVQITHFVGIQKKMDLSNKFFRAIQSTAKEFAEKGNVNDAVFKSVVLDRAFRGRGGVGFSNSEEQSKSLKHRIELELGEDGETPRERHVSILADVVYDYLNEANEIIKYISSQGKVAEDNLGKLIKMLEQMRNQAVTDREEMETQQKMNMVKMASSMIAEFVNVMCMNITNCYNVSLKIADKAKTDYINSIL